MMKVFRKIKEIIYKYLKTWWIPILCYIIPIGIFFLAELLKRDVLIDIFLILFYINFLGNIASGIIQIYIRKWYFLIPQIVISIFLFYYLSIIFTYSPPDYYGAHKEIPDNIEIYKPLEFEPNKDELNHFDLVLGNSIQPGIYIYYTDYKISQLGNYYIKAFEITSNDRLSEDRLTYESKIEIKNLKAKIYSKKFTIYEGSWGDKYAARIELWFEPLTGDDYKITERNYIIEGWMR